MSVGMCKIVSKIRNRNFVDERSMASSSVDNEIRIVLLGKTGVGKSATGNSLLGSPQFVSSAIGQSVTTQCQFAKGKVRDGTKPCIVDTPGLFATSESNKKTTKEIVNCVALSSPGPHVFLLILSIGRFTQEELDTVDHLVAVFGEDVINHVVIVFTYKEKLVYEKITLADYLKSVPPALSELVQRCGSHCATINNAACDAEVKADVDNIIKVVRKTIKENCKSYYTTEIYKAVEEKLKEKMRLMDEEKQRKVNESKRRLEEIERREKEHAESVIKLKADERRIQELAAEEERKRERRQLDAEMAELKKTNTHQQLRNIMETSKDFLGILREVVVGGLGIYDYVANKRSQADPLWRMHSLPRVSTNHQSVNVSASDFVPRCMSEPLFKPSINDLAFFQRVEENRTQILDQILNHTH